MHYNAYFLVKVLNVSKLEAISSIHCTASSIKLGMEFYKIKKTIKTIWDNHLHVVFKIILINYNYNTIINTHCLH